MCKSSITPTIDLDADGVAHGYLRLPHSRDDSAWGSVMIPITVAKNGNGPTAMVTGANHGDEYEGPLALTALTVSTFHQLTAWLSTPKLLVTPL